MGISDPISMNMAMRSAQSMSAVGYAVLNMQMDAMQTEGQNMVEALESTVNPAVGSNIDYRV